MKMTEGFVDFSKSQTGRKWYGSAWSPHKALLFHIVTNDYYSSKKTPCVIFFLATCDTKFIFRDVHVKLQACPVSVLPKAA
jgi:hypothetical protein